MDEINKMFEVWLEQHKKDCGNDTFTNRELNGYKDAWNAACEMMRGKVNQKDNEIRTVRAIAEGMCKEIDQANKTIQDLQQNLSEAKETTCHADPNCKSCGVVK